MFVKTITKLNKGRSDKFQVQILKLTVVVYVLQKKRNLVTSRCCLAEGGKEMFQALKHTCTAIVLLIRAVFNWVSKVIRQLRLVLVLLQFEVS